MKKIIGFSCLFLFMGFVAFGQSTVQTKALTASTTTSCKPMSAEACAAKMGISLEEYLKLPKKCGTTASAENAQTPSFQIIAVSDVKTSQNNCCGSVEECAKMLGVSVEECKSLCKGSSACNASSTKAEVASTANVY